MREHAQEHHFVRLARAVNADVREHGGRQEAARHIARFRPNARLPGGERSLRVARVFLLVARLEFAHDPRVESEQPIHDRVELSAQRRVFDLDGRGVFPVAVARAPLVVHDVARALFEVGREPRTLDDLGQDVGDVLAGEVRAAELCHGVVAVLGEHFLVQFLGAALAHRLARGDLRFR